MRSDNPTNSGSTLDPDSKVASFPNVWDAISDTKIEANTMKARSALMIAIEQHIKSQGWKQNQAADAFGVTQPRISDLLRGKIDKFSVDGLMAMAAVAGLEVQIRVLATT